MKYDPPFLKIPSARVRDEDKLLKLHRQTGKPIMMATGACTLDHIDHAVSVFDPGNLIIMHCVLNYPASDEELNLKMIQTLQDRYPGVSIGYSGHEKGVDTTVDAVVLGACIVERHITLDRTMFGSDQSASLEPHGLEMLVRNIRKWETASGSGSKSVSPAEEKNFQKLRRK
jgi:N-acetylneuraminate synthase